MRIGIDWDSPFQPDHAKHVDCQHEEPALNTRHDGREAGPENESAGGCLCCAALMTTGIAITDLLFGAGGTLDIPNNVSGWMLGIGGISALSIFTARRLSGTPLSGAEKAGVTLLCQVLLVPAIVIGTLCAVIGLPAWLFNMLTTR